MKIGLAPYQFHNLSSIEYIFKITAQVLRTRHELIFLPSECAYCSGGYRDKLFREWFDAIDIIVGPASALILGARHKMRITLPYVCILFGSISRGAEVLSEVHAHFLSSDIFIGNCTADLLMFHRFFENAQAKLVPFPFDESVFYPLREEEKHKIRQKMGFSSADRLLLYAGRITVEKNIHTLLRIFKIVSHIIPSSHLIIVGNDSNNPFLEFGVYPLSIRNMLTKVIRKLGLEGVSFLGPKNAQELREIYNISDLFVNMTLHHDENFGLAQVEAMACGTPVIGTRWGGLKDTVLDGETGASVSAIVTGLGVKVDWWEAANKIVALLKDPGEARRRSEVCRRTALEKYSLDRYLTALETIVAGFNGSQERCREPVRASEFAREFWQYNSLRVSEKPPYRRAAKGYEMYKTLISLFADRSQTIEDMKRNRLPHQIMCLAAPLIVADGMIAVNDPMFPFEVSIPSDIVDDVCHVIDVMGEHPAIRIESLRAKCAQTRNLNSALEWMVDRGLILLSTAVESAFPAEAVPSEMATPVFSIQGLSQDETDIVFVT